jgi:hypothetical protein
VTAGTVPAFPVRAASWWYVGQIAAGCAAAVGLGDALADVDALAEVDAAADGDGTADDAAALDTLAGLDAPALALVTGTGTPLVTGGEEWPDFVVVHAVARSRHATTVGNARFGLMPQSYPFVPPAREAW